MERHRAEKRSALHRRLKRIAGVAMIIIGLAELVMGILFALAPSLYDNFAGCRTWVYLVFGFILIALGGLLLRNNQECL